MFYTSFYCGFNIILTMRYIGTRLKQLLKGNRGAYADLAKRMGKYRRARKGEAQSDREYNLVPLMNDGHNITLSTLTGIMRETGKPISYFVEFEPGEFDGNFTPAEPEENKHLREIIELKNALIEAKDGTIEILKNELSSKNELLRKHNLI